MPGKAKPFVFELTDKESREFKLPVGDGGRQDLEQNIIDQLTKTPNVVELDDRNMGKVLRYMSQYDGKKPTGEGGGLQGRLHRAFSRSLKEKFKL